MANFRIYNVQLLPKTQEHHEVGVIGYKRLFAAFRKATGGARKEKRLLAYHRDVGRDSHFGPHEFHVEPGYVWGKFVRYKRTDKVDDLNTMKALFKEGARETGVASLSHMLFIFDCRDHFFAIEEAGASLPPNADFIRILNDYLAPLANELFPHHDLHILLIADKKSLEGVLSSASAFSHIEVELTFPNGAAENSLEALKRARIQKLKLSGSPGADGKISNELPSFMLDLIKGGIKFGRTKLSYFVKAGQGAARAVYDSDTMPLKFEKRRNATDTDESFVQRCIDDLREAIGEIAPPLLGPGDEG